MKDFDSLQASRNAELRSAVANPRHVDIAGLHVALDPDVFPPDLGISSLLMADFLNKLPVAERALDMGTGSGFLAMVLKKRGTSCVTATDIHEPAIACARKNFRLNGMEKMIDLRQSDLFDSIPDSRRFDLIVFNQPFYPIFDEPIAGMGEDGGRAITFRFLTRAFAFLAPNGSVVMSSGALVDAADRPDAIAAELNWAITGSATSADGFATVWQFQPPQARRAGR